MASFAPRICKVCGKEFIPVAPNQVACSSACKIINRETQHKIWFEENKDKLRARKRKKYRQDKEKEKKLLVIDFENYDEYAERQKKESIEKYARIEL